MRDHFDLSGDFRHSNVSIVTNGEPPDSAPSADPDLAAALALLAIVPLDEVPEPTPLPPVSVIPWAANPIFVGREAKLLALARVLATGGAAAIGQTASASGLGGIGKTQLAAEFAHRYGRFFAGGIFWIDCSEPAAIAMQVAECGVGLGLHSSYATLSNSHQVSLVRAAWQRPMPRLLIFDNCEEEVILLQWRPVSGGCRVLVTSRRASWSLAAGVHVEMIEVLPRPSSIELLRIGRPELLMTDPDLNSVAEVLGDLPLALHLAASFLSQYRHSPFGQPARYLTALKNAPVLDHPSLIAGDWSPTGHEQHVARTFAVSYNQLNPENLIDAMAQELLAFAAWLAPGVAIPRMILAPTGEFEESADLEVLQRQEAALRRLTNLGLIEEQGDGALVLHRLLAAFAQANQSCNGIEETVEAYLLFVAKGASAIEDFRPFNPWQPHLLHVAASAATRGSKYAEGLYMELGQHNYKSGNFSEARSAFEHALVLIEARGGPDHLETAAILNNLAITYRVVGDNDTAVTLMRRAIEIEKRNPYTKKMVLAKGYYNLGCAIMAMDSTEAFEVLDAARAYVEADERDSDDAEVSDDDLEARRHERKVLLVRTLTHLADAVRDDQPSRAQAFLNRAITEAENTFGSNHFELWHPLSTLAYMRMADGDMVAARQHFKRALMIIEEHQGSESPLLGDVLLGLGKVLHHLDDPAAAKPVLERALTIAERSVGRDHPNVQHASDLLAQTCLATGDFPAAHKLLDHAVIELSRRFGPRHPRLAGPLIGLGLVCTAMGDDMTALRHWRQGLQNMKKSLRPDRTTMRDVRRLIMAAEERIKLRRT